MLVDLPWERASFEEDRRFLHAACERAQSGDDLPLIDRSPDRAVLRSFFVRLGIMVRTLTVGDLDGRRSPIDVPPAEELQLCERHPVYLHPHGCIVCNVLTDSAPGSRAPDR